MNDREQAITTLTEHLNHWKRLLSEGICTKDEGERTINALTFAIESIKVDRAYDLAYEKVDFIEIPEGATNGDMLLSMFDTATVYGIDKENDCITICIDNNFYQKFRYSWWNSPYRKEQK